MSQRNDDPRRGQVQGRENLASELWNQQQQQYHQQPAYPAPSWSQAPFGAQVPPIPPPPSWPQTPFGVPAPPLPHNFNPQSTSVSPSWGPQGWAPYHNNNFPPPPPQGGFQPWAQGAPVPPPGHNYPVTTIAPNSSNTRYFYDLRDGPHNPKTRPFASTSESRRNYSTEPRNRGGGGGDPNEIILTDTDTQSPPPTMARKPNRSKKNQSKETVSRPDDRPKAAPSAASGGVPDPTPEYLAQASVPPSELPSGARPILVVIDLNGTLVFRKDPKRHPQICTLRPHAKAFLSHCLINFKVAIWSSAQPKNVRIMVESLLPSEEQRSQLVVQWARDKFGLTEEDSLKRIQCYKRLTRLWEDEAVKSTGNWDQTNTVLIDDSIEKARSEPYNAITIPEFTGNLREKPVVLELVQEYLDILAKQAGISSYIKLHPFKESSTTSNSTIETTPTAAAAATEEERPENTTVTTNPDEIDLNMESPGKKEAHEEEVGGPDEQTSEIRPQQTMGSASLG